ncbi:HEPN domain-containing protein [Aeromonas caviae]|uniref:HEPN domain-containing protein n=1 Tax=Aeromonas caviae TaxID=648 RepID=UPI001CC3E416|nr:HEPN domain-containing protein [Aeromonas caviae]BDA15246.1 hypothetical protein KAM339_037870 [Aeromonas caviae]
MDVNHKIRLIASYIGPRLLTYSLAIDSEKPEELDKIAASLSEVQNEVVHFLAKKIEEIRIRQATEGIIGDSISLSLSSLEIAGKNIFDFFRKHCGGSYPQYKTDDPILSLLVTTCISEYPILMLRHSQGSHDVGMYINTNHDNVIKFISLVKSDILNKITNQKDGFDYCFAVRLDNGTEFSTQVYSAFNTLIIRSFQNACNKMAYSLSDVLKEIDINLNSLRELASNGEIEYSYFMGIRGMNFDGFTDIEFDQNTYLRQFDSPSNPSAHSLTTISHNFSGESNYISGHVLEIKERARLIDTNASMTCAMGVHCHKKTSHIIDTLKLSLAFALREDRGISHGFSESGFPLLIPGNYSISSTPPSKYLTVNTDNIEPMKNWFKQLSDVNLEHINIPLQRLKNAIFERSHPEDAIVDAIIAWEGMFSEAFETSFKVTASMAKYLAEPADRDEFYQRLRKLYTLRSDIVHGKKSKLMTPENIDSLRSEVIDIGIRCITKLISDHDILPKSSGDRVKEILVNR